MVSIDSSKRTGSITWRANKDLISSFSLSAPLYFQLQGFQKLKNELYLKHRSISDLQVSIKQCEKDLKHSEELNVLLLVVLILLQLHLQRLTLPYNNLLWSIIICRTNNTKLRSLLTSIFNYLTISI